MSKPPSKRPLHWAWIALSAVTSAILCSSLIFVIAAVPSASMEPTIRAGQWVFGWRPAYYFGQPVERGDIVLFHRRELTDELLVKRVVAVAGDTVELRAGRVCLNGEPLGEPYAQLGDRDRAAMTVPEGYCYVLGDHRAASNDSSLWDDPFVPCDQVVAKVILIYG